MIDPKKLGMAAQLIQNQLALEMDNRGQTRTNLVGLFIGIMVAAVVAIEVVIPIIEDAVASSNASGTTLTILGLISTFIALLLLMAVVSPLMNRM